MSRNKDMKKDIEVIVGTGKGGVGKSTVVGADAISREGLVDVIDSDEGHRMANILGADRGVGSNRYVPTPIKNINVATLDPIEFTTITESQARGWPLKRYLTQFSGQHGIVPFCDMMTEFFAVPTAIDEASKFASLIGLFYEAMERGSKYIHLDVEPTAGLKRLLNSTETMKRSLTNLQRTGRITLGLLGTKWPDVAGYMGQKGGFIKRADHYAEAMIDISGRLRDAKYFLTCVPEEGPVEQMRKVRGIIEGYGASVDGYVVNRHGRGDPEEEAEQVAIVHEMAGGLPIAFIKEDPRLKKSGPKMIQALREHGAALRKVFGD